MLAAGYLPQAVRTLVGSVSPWKRLPRPSYAVGSPQSHGETDGPATKKKQTPKRRRVLCGAFVKVREANYMFPQGGTQWKVAEGLLIQKSHLKQKMYIKKKKKKKKRGGGRGT